LEFNKFCIGPTTLDLPVVGAFFPDDPVSQHQDAVCKPNGYGSVGDQHRRLSHSQFPEPLKD
jgi:hypothetical protein